MFSSYDLLFSSCDLLFSSRDLHGSDPEEDETEDDMKKPDRTQSYSDQQENQRQPPRVLPADFFTMTAGYHLLMRYGNLKTSTMGIEFGHYIG